MDIQNDTDRLLKTRNILVQKKKEFGDVNLYMIEMINFAKNSLEGDQMNLAEQKIFELINQIKQTILSIDEMIRFINNMIEILNKYILCKFKEV